MGESLTARVLRSPLLLLAAVFVVTAAFRFLTFVGLPNDHFVHLTPAQQMLFGDWPTRDFQDPGLTLMYVASALAQLLIGHTLFAEAVLVAVAFGVAAALTLATVRALTGSVLLALVAVGFEVAIFPRTYSYPKILLYAAAFFLFQRYVTLPTTRRLAAMAVLVAVAFLFRHDHGLYLWAGGVLTAALGTLEPGLRARARRAAIFTAIVAALLLPYFAYVQVSEGLWLYVRTGIEFSRREASRGGHPWPSLFGPEPAYAFLVYLFYVLPLVAIAVAVAGRKRENSGRVIAQLLPLAVVAGLVNVSFIRDPLVTRVPDAVVPAIVIGAWLMARAWTTTFRLLAVPVALTAIALAGWSTIVVGHMADEIDRLGVDGLMSLPKTFVQRTAGLRARFDPQQMTTPTIARLLPFFAFLDRCTTENHRLLTAGFMPELPYYARRAFAGGQNVFMFGYYGSEDNQRQVVDRLSRQTVPFVLVPSDYAKDLEVDFPIVAAYLTQRYRTLVTLDVHEDLSIEVRVDRTLPEVSRDADTGWPCFR